MSKIWWIEDYLSGKAIDNRYYSTKEEAIARRDELGYGHVKSWEVIKEDGTQYYEESACGRKIRVFTNPVE